jgi:N-carbamoylputrescine amidase
MKLALCVNHIRKEISQNIESMKRYISKAALNSADCIVFSEAALTGLINNDDPEHDLGLSYSVESIEIQNIFDFCAENKIDIVFGFFEKSDSSIYDSAVYFDHQKNKSYVYRRITEGWYGPEADKSVYKCGSGTDVFSTGIGKVSFLICGDLFDDKLLEAVRINDSELVIVPFARCFAEGIDPVTEWNSVEKNAYAEQVKKIIKETVLVNYISGCGQEDYFGGAMYVGKEGKI